MNEYIITYSGKEEQEQIEEKLLCLGFDIKWKSVLLKPDTYVVEYCAKQEERKQALEIMEKIEGLEYRMSKEYGESSVD